MFPTLQYILVLMCKSTPIFKQNKIGEGRSLIYRKYVKLVIASSLESFWLTLLISVFCTTLNSIRRPNQIENLSRHISAQNFVKKLRKK